MSIPSEFLPTLETLINRLAAESVLARAGRDDGLVPAYSLLGELAEICSTDAGVREPILALHTALERQLDAAKPFDHELVNRLMAMAGWLPLAVDAVKNRRVIPPLLVKVIPAGSVGPTEESSERPAVVDAVLDIQMEGNRELLFEFHGEAVDHLQKIEAALLVLDQNADDPEALNSIFRSFHTIKGNAGFLGLGPMQTLAHEVESLLDLARNRKLRLSPAIITEILRSRDALQEFTAQVARALEKGILPNVIVPIADLVATVKKFTDDANGVASAPPAASAKPAPTQVAIALAETVSPFSRPAVPAAEPQPAAKAASALVNALAPSPSKGGGNTVRVNTDKLDSLMDVVGELVIVQSQLIETSRQSRDEGSPLQRNVAQLSRLTKELQHTAMSLRMIPIKATFQKMERLARDLAREFGKKVLFSTSGDETELDRTVVEEIGDPLVHMVRNALDHGLELPDMRVRGGKAETGALHLKAYHQGGNIVIELQDDGRGIDPDKIYRKAVEKNIIAAGATLNREEIFGLIFAPGFSTAEKVTAVSGRGVGMDVVKRNIEKLRGKIEIESEVGKGSTFKIKLPLTMAIIDGLVVRVGADRFILPTTAVQRALRPLRESISTIHGQGEVLDLRGRLLPLRRLHELLGISADSKNSWDGIAVIIEHSGKLSALLVDEMISKQEVVIKNLGAYMHGLPGVAGGAILGDGNIALILDPASLLLAA